MTAPPLPVVPDDPAWLIRHEHSVLSTGRPFEFVDLTPRVVACVRRSGVVHGIVSVQTRHTTTAILLNEHEPLLFEDLEARLERFAPARAAYRHDDLRLRTVNRTRRERRNGHAHARAAVLGASESVHVVDGRLGLGRWQRILFVEMDGPQERTVSVVVMGACGSGARRCG
jgi:secondary thiamine-phosphate synthase enzyme